MVVRKAEEMSDHKYGLGRVVSKSDDRDYKLSAYIPARKTDVVMKVWDFPVQALDQKDKPHCGGFSMAHYGICLPMFSNYSNEDGDKFYYRCKEFDLQPGMENGTSIRSIANVGKNLGMWKTYAFATTMEEISYWLLNKGPIIFGTNWYNNMFLPDKNNIIHCTGDLAGGHAWVGIGKDPEYIHGITTWGPTFADNGKFRIPIKEFEELFKKAGEGIAAVEIGKVDPAGSETKTGCSNTALGKVLGRVFK
jgi:hypothetical protein